MESPPPIARYTLQQSMKRMFTGSSASYMDPEVVEIPPPVSWRSNSKSIKRKEVIHHEVIDIDMDEDSLDLMLIDDKVDTQEKGKGFFRSKKKPAVFSSSTNYASNYQLEAMKFSAGVESSFGGSYPCSKRKKPVDNSYKSASTAGSSSSNIEKNSEENGILKKFQDFKQFDMVQDYSDHHYSSKGSTAYQPSKAWAKKIQDEWRILEKDLPDAIFVRVYESRMDLLRAVIVGAEGTPYHDGLFFFDVFFPCSYPKVPPHVYYHSGGLRINPNLYDCGKVCLSLLNTWSGGQKEKWIPGVSTMLQVLVSIQALILNQKPYFNEPAYAGMCGSASGEKSSQQYNENTFILSLKTMVYTMKRPPKHFEDFAVGHFYKHAQDILVACKAYLDGAQVGCLAKGGVQDVDEGDQSCSQNFKKTLAGSITVLVKSFSKVGAKDSEKFLSLARKINDQVPAIPTASNYYF